MLGRATGSAYPENVLCLCIFRGRGSAQTKIKCTPSYASELNIICMSTRFSFNSNAQSDEKLNIGAINDSYYFELGKKDRSFFAKLHGYI